MNSEYLPHSIYEGETKVLYLKVLRTIYDCLELAILWYNLYVKTLEDMGLELNPYYLCVANNTITGKQGTIILCR